MLRFRKGGIHPFSKKEYTKKKPLIDLTPQPNHIVLPLHSPSGGVLTPLVASGDRVKRGELIAVPSDENAVALYSGISGKIMEITQSPHPLFGKCPSILIENDFQEGKEKHKGYLEPETLSQEQIIARIKDLGVRDLGKEETPVHLKILENRGRVEKLVVNGCEDEPYLTTEHRLMLEKQDTLVSGAKILAYTLGITEIIFAIQGDKLDAIESLEKTEIWDSSSMTVRTLPTGYPYGQEKQILRTLSSIEVPTGQQCHSAGYAFFTVATVVAVAQAILYGQPQTHRAITVSGSGVNRPRNFWLPIGTTVETLLKDTQSQHPEKLGLLLLGGPMTGVPQQDIRCPILPSSSAVLAFAQGDLPPHVISPKAKKQVCIRCGHCLSVCPMHLAPSMVYAAMEKTNTPSQKERALRPLSPDTCISCGSCNYRCPARLPLAQTLSEAQTFLQSQQEQQEITMETQEVRH